MLVRFLLVFESLFILFRIALWERDVPLAFHLCCFSFGAVLVVCVPLSFGVWGGVWDSVVSVSDHCLFIYFVEGKRY